MLSLLISSAKGLAKAAGKSLNKTKNIKEGKEIKNFKDIKGEDLRNRHIETDEKIIQSQENTVKSLEQIEENEKKTKVQIIRTEDRISSIEDKIEHNVEEKNDDLVNIERKQLEVQKRQLKVQKEQLEEQKEAEYRAEHHRKLTLKDKAKSMTTNTRKNIGKGVGAVVTKVKENRGFLSKLLGVGALIAMFWPIIKEKLGAFVEWVAEKIPGIIKSVWGKIKDMAEGLADLVIKYGPGLIKNVLDGLGEVASSLLKGIIKYGPKVLTMLINGVKTLAEKVLSGIVEYGPKVAKMLWNGLKGLLKAVVPLLIKYVPKIASLIWDGMKVVINETVDIIKEYGPKVWDMIKSGLTTAVNWVVDTASEYGPEVWKNFKSGLGKAVDWVVDKASTFGEDMWIDIKKGFSNLAKLVKDKISALGDDISNYIYEATNGLVGTKKMDDKSVKDMSLAAKGDTEAFLEKVESYGIIDESDIAGRDSTITDEKKLRGLPIDVIQALLDSDDFSDEDEKLFKDIIKQKVANDTSRRGENPVADMIEVHKNQFNTGGWTGDGDSKEVAGVVHYNEFVLSEDMLKEIENAKDEGERDALVKKAAKGKGKKAEEAIRALLERNKPSGFNVEINGVSVMLTNAQKEAYDKIEKNSKNVFDAMDREENLINSISKGKWKDKNATKVRFESDDKPLATAISASTNNSSLTKDSGTTFTPEPVKVKPKIPAAANDSSIPKSVNDIKESDVFKGVKIKNMNPDVEHNLKAMGFEYKERFGQKLQLNSTGRSIKEQQKLYNDMLKRNNGKSDGSVATPGGSMHNYGLAVDAQSVQLNIAEKAGLLDKYGFHRNVYKKDGKLETWHMEPSSLSAQDRKNVRAAGKKAIKKGKDVDKLVANGEFTRNKIDRVDANGNKIVTKVETQETQSAANTSSYTPTEGPAAGNDVSSIIEKPEVKEVKPEIAEIKTFSNTAVGRAEKEAYDKRFEIIEPKIKAYEKSLSSLGDSEEDKEKKTNIKNMIKDLKSLQGKLEDENYKTTTADEELIEKAQLDSDNTGSVSEAETAAHLIDVADKKSLELFQQTMIDMGFASEDGSLMKSDAEKKADMSFGDRIKQSKDSTTEGISSLVNGMGGIASGTLSNASGFASGAIGAAGGIVTSMGGGALVDSIGGAFTSGKDKLVGLFGKKAANDTKPSNETGTTLASVAKAANDTSTQTLGNNENGVKDVVNTNAEVADIGNKEEKYEVQPGDTLASIAKQKGISLTELSNLNPDIDDYEKMLPMGSITISKTKPKAVEQSTDVKEPASEDKITEDINDNLGVTVNGQNKDTSSLGTVSKEDKSLEKLVTPKKEKFIPGVELKRKEDFKKRFDLIDDRLESYREVSKSLEGKEDEESKEKKSKIDTKIKELENIKNKLSNYPEMDKIDKQIEEIDNSTEAILKEKESNEALLKELENSSSPEDIKRKKELEERNKVLDAKKAANDTMKVGRQDAIKALGGRTTKEEDEIGLALKFDENGDGEMSSGELFKQGLQEADESSLNMFQQTMMEMGFVGEDGSMIKSDAEKKSEMSFADRIKESKNSTAEGLATITAGIGGIGKGTFDNVAGMASDAIGAAQGLGASAIDGAKNMGSKAADLGSKAWGGLTGLFSKGDKDEGVEADNTQIGLGAAANETSKSKGGLFSKVKGFFSGGDKSTEVSSEEGKTKAIEIPKKAANMELIDKSSTAKSTGNIGKTTNTLSSNEVEISTKRKQSISIDNEARKLAATTAPVVANKSDDKKQTNTVIMQTPPAAEKATLSLSNVDMEEKEMAYLGRLW